MSDTTIEKEWNKWIARAINSHFGYHLTDTQGVTVIFPNQEEPDQSQLEKWIELSLFGPLYETRGRSVSATIQVQTRAFLQDGGNLYAIDDLIGAIANAATLPIRVPELDNCLSNLGVRVLSKGRILHPHAAVAAEVDVTLTIQLKE